MYFQLVWTSKLQLQWRMRNQGKRTKLISADHSVVSRSIGLEELRGAMDQLNPAEGRARDRKWGTYNRRMALNSDLYGEPQCAEGREGPPKFIVGVAFLWGGEGGPTQHMSDWLKADRTAFPIWICNLQSGGGCVFPSFQVRYTVRQYRNQPQSHCKISHPIPVQFVLWFQSQPKVDLAGKIGLPVNSGGKFTLQWYSTTKFPVFKIFEISTAEAPFCLLDPPLLSTWVKDFAKVSDWPHRSAIVNVVNVDGEYSGIHPGGRREEWRFKMQSPSWWQSYYSYSIPVSAANYMSWSTLSSNFTCLGWRQTQQNTITIKVLLVTMVL